MRLVFADPKSSGGHYLQLSKSVITLYVFLNLTTVFIRKSSNLISSEVPSAEVDPPAPLPGRKEHKPMSKRDILILTVPARLTRHVIPMLKTQLAAGPEEPLCPLPKPIQCKCNINIVAHVLMSQRRYAQL